MSLIDGVVRKLAVNVTFKKYLTEEYVMDVLKRAFQHLVKFGYAVTDQSFVQLLGLHIYIPVGKMFNRQFAIVFIPSVTPKAPKPTDHPKAIYLTDIKTNLHSVPFVTAYLISYPKNSERWKEIVRHGLVVSMKK